MGKEKQVLLAAQSITVGYWATGSNGARTRLKTPGRVSAFVSGGALVARTDLPVKFDGTGSNATGRNGNLAELFLVLQRILVIVIYTGLAFS